MKFYSNHFFILGFCWINCTVEPDINSAVFEHNDMTYDNVPSQSCTHDNEEDVVSDEVIADKVFACNIQGLFENKLQETVVKKETNSFNKFVSFKNSDGFNTLMKKSSILWLLQKNRKE